MVTAKTELRATKIVNDGVVIKQNLNAVCVEAEKGYFLVQRNKHTQRIFVCMENTEITENYSSGKVINAHGTYFTQGLLFKQYIDDKYQVLGIIIINAD